MAKEQIVYANDIDGVCPFCGGTKICTEKSINLNYCDNCSAESNVEHWNTRPIEDALTARIAELEATVEVGADIAKAYENRVSEIVALSNETVGKLNFRIAELEMKIRHNALWQASEDAEERAHLEKLVPDLKKRIDNLTAENKVLGDACEILRKENKRLFSQVFLNAYGKEREE